MTQTPEVRSATRQLSFQIEVIMKLPTTLDTLQCYMLCVYGVYHPSVFRYRNQLVSRLDTLVAILGLEFDASNHADWLERRLALYASKLEIYYISGGHCLSRMHIFYTKVYDQHFKKSFLSKKIQQGKFRYFEDLILFIIYHCQYYGYVTIISAYRHHTNAVLNEAEKYKEAIIAQQACLQKNFLWGWQTLSSLKNPHNGSIILRACITLALRYHNDYIRLMLMASHIPETPCQRLSPRPLTKKLTCFTKEGLASCIRIVYLLSTLKLVPFHIQPIRLVNFSIAFIILNFKAARFEYNTSICLNQSLQQAKSFLLNAIAIPFFSNEAQISLDILTVLCKQYRINLDK
ncbi:hypothetical protein DSO57_1039306 [Entomophthora muscae]|uniref:Uncharacterized protein n=1 Tax=Entomophthora muscae TaxID=34485 RepID=A0ACC2RPD1_9FUNG|nr:hypothetical protein DSO57_1039306 [Entomophthora muscae]